MSYKGRFKPKHYNKYKGDPTKIIYRSLWERRFMKYCDDNPNILKWSSEEVVIPYRLDDGSFHRYFPDFMIEYRDKDGELLTAKQAYNQMSYRFHGHGPGVNKLALLNRRKEKERKERERIRYNRETFEKEKRYVYWVDPFKPINQNRLGSSQIWRKEKKYKYYD